MGSFDTPHFMYLFNIKSGGKKLCYGASPEDAFEVLSFRLPEEELADVDPTDYMRISQTEMQKYVHLLR